MNNLDILLLYIDIFLCTLIFDYLKYKISDFNSQFLKIRTVTFLRKFIKKNIFRFSPLRNSLRFFTLESEHRKFIMFLISADIYLWVILSKLFKIKGLRSIKKIKNDKKEGMHDSQRCVLALYLIDNVEENVVFLSWKVSNSNNFSIVYKSKKFAIFKTKN